MSCNQLGSAPRNTEKFHLNKSENCRESVYHGMMIVIIIIMKTVSIVVAAAKCAHTYTGHGTHLYKTFSYFSCCCCFDHDRYQLSTYILWNL